MEMKGVIMMLSFSDAWSRVSTFWIRGQGLPAAQGGRASLLSLVNRRTEFSEARVVAGHLESLLKKVLFREVREQPSCRCHIDGW